MSEQKDQVARSSTLISQMPQPHPGPWHDDILFEVRKISREHAQYVSNDDGDDGLPAWPRYGQACFGIYASMPLYNLASLYDHQKNTLNFECNP